MRGAGERQDATPLASLLKQYMDERGLNQTQLAERARLSSATLSRWLNGKSVKPYHRGGLLGVAAALSLPKVSANRLLRAANLPPIDALARTPSAEERTLLERWSLPTRNNLPAGLTSFVGRVDEVTGLAELLSRDGVRLVTLTGTGGSGKTRLALRVAGEVLDAFPDGVFFVPLVAVSDSELVVKTVAETVGLRDVLDSSLQARLAGWLRTRRVLLLLDNLEQVVDCGPDVVALLRAAPHVKVLATSRVPLRVYGEHAWPVEPLPLPEPDRPRRVLLTNPAVELFLERARSANPRRALDDNEELAAVAELCVRLDGLPLAIELAAARTRDRGPERLLAEFAGRLDLGSAGPRDVLPRQQTLRDAIAWSLDLLPEPARAFLLRLSVFVGGWTEPAAVEVCSLEGMTAGDVEQTLTALVDASLVVRVAAAAPGGARRYRMLETIREYGAELLAATGHGDTLRERHARYFLALAESAAPYVPDARPNDWYERVDTDLDNVRAALSWAATRDDPELLVRLTAAFWPYWLEYGRVSEGRHWLEAALDRSDQTTPRLLASLLTGACTMTSIQSELRQAEAYGGQALALWQELEDQRGQALVYRQFALGEYSGHVTEQTLPWFETALEHWRMVGDEDGIARALSDLGLAHCVLLGDLAMASRYFDEAEDLCRHTHDEVGLARALRDRGVQALLSGDVLGAVTWLGEADERLRASGRTSFLGGAAFYLGTALCFAGNLDEAVDAYSESLRIHEETGDRLQTSLTVLGLAAVAHRRGDGVRAARLCGASRALQQAFQITVPPAADAIYQREVAMVLDLIGQERFDAAFAEGSAMTPAEVMTLARAGSQRR